MDIKCVNVVGFLKIVFLLKHLHELFSKTHLFFELQSFLNRAFDVGILY